MGTLEKLISQLCPDGVEYKPLGEVCKIEKGVQLNRETLKEEGAYPVINGGINPSGFWDEYNYEAHKITISQGGASAGYVNWMSSRFWAGAHCFVLDKPSPGVVYRYLFYVVKASEHDLMQSQIGAGIPSVSTAKLSSVSVPLPTLSVQKEIVRMLDDMAGLIDALEEELAARKKQYEWCRERLLENVVTIRDIATVARGKVISKDYLKDHAGDYPVYSSQTLNNGEFGRIDTYDFEGEYLTWTTDGANAGSVFYRNGKFSITNVCGLIRVTDKSVDTRYLHYALKEEAIKYVSPGMGNAKLMSNVMLGISLSLPPLSEQRRIVKILDSFDTLCNSMTEGLPGEIALRKQQYEHYRDKLLAFKRKPEVA